MSLIFPPFSAQGAANSMGVGVVIPRIDVAIALALILAYLAYSIILLISGRLGRNQRTGPDSDYAYIQFTEKLLRSMFRGVIPADAVVDADFVLDEEGIPILMLRAWRSGKNHYAILPAIVDGKAVLMLVLSRRKLTERRLENLMELTRSGAVKTFTKPARERDAYKWLDAVVGTLGYKVRIDVIGGGGTLTEFHVAEPKEAFEIRQVLEWLEKVAESQAAIAAEGTEEQEQEEECNVESILEADLRTTEEAPVLRVKHGLRIVTRIKHMYPLSRDMMVYAEPVRYRDIVLNFWFYATEMKTTGKRYLMVLFMRRPDMRPSTVEETVDLIKSGNAREFLFNRDIAVPWLTQVIDSRRIKIEIETVPPSNEPVSGWKTVSDDEVDYFRELLRALEEP